MRKLNLDFLTGQKEISGLDPMEQILRGYGQQISEYAKGYFTCIVTTTSDGYTIKDASLYILVPEIGYDYKILTISRLDVENVSVMFFTLKTKQVQQDKFSIKDNWDAVHNQIFELLSGGLARQTFLFLVEQVNMKREEREEKSE